MSEFDHGIKKSSGLAITSLVLGILGLVCCGIFTGIAAIICGHIARGNALKSPERYGGAGMALAGLILGYVSIVSTALWIMVSMPAISSAKQIPVAAQQLTHAKLIETAMTKMAEREGYPADAGIKTVRELKTRLVKGGFATEAELAGWHLEDFLVGNVSKADPEDTILLYIPPAPPKMGVVYEKNGLGQILMPSIPNQGQEPPRQPPYLAP